MAMINIEKAPGQPNAQFDPDPIAVAVGEVVAWTNRDSVKHWPGPVANPKGWLDDAIAGKLPGEPAPSSDGVSFAAADTYEYVCVYHPGETGTITAS